MALQELYAAAHKKMVDHSSEFFKDQNIKSEFGKHHNFAADVELLIDALGEKQESEILRLGLQEYHYSLLSLVSGNYRNASKSLRLFFELGTSAIFFSAYRIKLRNWFTGQQDVNWKATADEETGLFSNQFISPFTKELAKNAKQYREIASRVFRELSEYVHGNFGTFQNSDETHKIDNDIVKVWFERCEAVQICLLYSYACRYLGTENQKFRDEVEHIFIDRLGHLSGIQEIYAKAGN